VGNVTLAKIPIIRDIFRAESPDERATRKEFSRLASHPVESAEDVRTVRHACKLARDPRFRHLSNAELLRLAYWGDPRTEDIYGREMLKAPENRTEPT